ncbi:Hpr(Ser) kinase/phosphatase [Roseicitreum antarcticum]|uniref:Hpr(Ser) kinase/phosphatase n=1 Tax=Roseicitreum antarcticum TaxID=564137 RepID=A0A1H3ANJ7_9RHOB|nr:Hpr(Ser) kinase/phosphatase [Roseicitreum antarcticum]
MIVHASCVACPGAQGAGAVLILGPSGAGKSTLALMLMSHGAQLVADDRTILRITDTDVTASAPEAIAGQIEARGVGILRAVPCAQAPVRLVVDMGRVEDARLPPARWHLLGPHAIPLLHKAETVGFPAAVWQYMLTAGTAWQPGQEHPLGP